MDINSILISYRKVNQALGIIRYAANIGGFVWWVYLNPSTGELETYFWM